MDLYQQNILDHYKNPRCLGKLAKFTHHGKAAIVSCGDDVEIFALVEKEKIVDIAWQGNGCVLSQAMASIVCEEIKGKALTDIKKITKDYVIKKLGSEPGPNRFNCAWLCVNSLNKLKQV